MLIHYTVPVSGMRNHNLRQPPASHRNWFRFFADAHAIHRGADVPRFYKKMAKFSYKTLTRWVKTQAYRDQL